FFSPLQNDPPHPDATHIFLPGGYPELFAETLSKKTKFIKAMQKATQSADTIYGECGGFMVMGQSIIDADNHPHKMCAILPATTSIAHKKRVLGYRQISFADPSLNLKSHASKMRHEARINGPQSLWRGHEYHYASLVEPTKNAQNISPMVYVSDLYNQHAWAGMQHFITQKNGAKTRQIGSFIHFIERV
ncbi:MAG: hypothetical protein AAF403_07440, partial [Pseudomonadota bacterium]